MKTFSGFFLLLIFFISFDSVPAHSQGFFSRTIDTGGDESAISLAEKPDGSFFVLVQPDNFTDHFFLTALDVGGQMQWSKRFSVQANERVEPKKIIRTSNHNYAILAYVSLFPTSTTRSILLILTDPNGSILWMNSFGSPPGTGNMEIPYTFIERSEGGFAIVGQRVTSSTDYPFMILTDALGNPVHFISYNTINPTKAWATDLKQTSQGDYIITGSSSDNAFLLRTDSTGAPRWIRKYLAGGSGSGGYSVVISHDSCFVMLGYDLSGTAAHTFLAKVSSSGAMLWNREYQFMPNYIEYFPVYQLANGNYNFVSGVAYGPNSNTHRFVIAETDSSGNLIFVHRYHPSMKNVPVFMQLTGSNTAMVTGYLVDSLTMEQHAFIMRSTLGSKSGECGEEDILVSQINGVFPEDTGVVAVPFSGNALPVISVSADSVSVATICESSEPAGESELSLDNFNIYPNPATNQLIIENGELKIVNIELYNAVGEIVFSSHHSSFITHHSIDVSQLPSGIYFITATDLAGNKVTKKVVKL